MRHRKADWASNIIDVLQRVFQFSFVKIILLKNDNCVLTLRKRLFCVAKPTLLPCKRAAFGTQNNRFCNVLIIRWLSGDYAYEKYLHIYRLIFVRRITWVCNILACFLWRTHVQIGNKSKERKPDMGFLSSFFSLSNILFRLNESSISQLLQHLATLCLR